MLNSSFSLPTHCHFEVHEEARTPKNKGKSHIRYYSVTTAHSQSSKEELSGKVGWIIRLSSRLGRASFFSET